MEKDSGSNMDMENENLESGNRVVGLILAAGLSSRMGTFKPLLPIGDVPAIVRVSGTLKQAGIHSVVAVTGYQRERLSPILASEGIEEAFNPDFEQGMFTSIQTGIRKALGASEKPDGFFLMLVDSPLIPVSVLGQILKKHKEFPESFIVPCYRGKKGHPLFIPGRYAEEILAYEGGGGLKAITTCHESSLIRLETGIEAVVLDMDTPEGYEELLEYYEKHPAGTDNPGMADNGSATLGFNRALKGKRLFLIRHGETRQHKEKIFLGQTDIPLSEKGRQQAHKAAEELNRHEVSIRRIYTSDLSRTLETAEIIRDNLTRPDGTDWGRAADSELEIVPVPKLREMSLGEWDGRFIREIREQFPEEYEKRGKNLLTYKFGNDSENFYDLKYRAVKGLQSVLKQEREAGESCRDIVIVAHSGVINVILSELLHKELSEQIGKKLPNGGFILIDDFNSKEKQI